MTPEEAVLHWLYVKERTVEKDPRAAEALAPHSVLPLFVFYYRLYLFALPLVLLMSFVAIRGLKNMYRRHCKAKQRSSHLKYSGSRTQSQSADLLKKPHSKDIKSFTPRRHGLRVWNSRSGSPKKPVHKSVDSGVMLAITSPQHKIKRSLRKVDMPKTLANLANTVTHMTVAGSVILDKATNYEACEKDGSEKDVPVNNGTCTGKESTSTKTKVKSTNKSNKIADLVSVVLSSKNSLKDTYIVSDKNNTVKIVHSPHSQVNAAVCKINSKYRITNNGGHPVGGEQNQGLVKDDKTTSKNMSQITIDGANAARGSQNALGPGSEHSSQKSLTLTGCDRDNTNTPSHAIDKFREINCLKAEDSQGSPTLSHDVSDTSKWTEPQAKGRNHKRQIAKLGTISESECTELCTSASPDFWHNGDHINKKGLIRRYRNQTRQDRRGSRDRRSSRSPKSRSKHRHVRPDKDLLIQRCTCGANELQSTRDLSKSGSAMTVDDAAVDLISGDFGSICRKYVVRKRYSDSKDSNISDPKRLRKDEGDATYYRLQKDEAKRTLKWLSREKEMMENKLQIQNLRRNSRKRTSDAAQSGCKLRLSSHRNVAVKDRYTHFVKSPTLPERSSRYLRRSMQSEPVPSRKLIPPKSKTENAFMQMSQESNTDHKHSAATLACLLLCPENSSNKVCATEEHKYIVPLTLLTCDRVKRDISPSSGQSNYRMKNIGKADIARITYQAEENRNDENATKDLINQEMILTNTDASCELSGVFKSRKVCKICVGDAKKQGKACDVKCLYSSQSIFSSTRQTGEKKKTVNSPSLSHYLNCLKMGSGETNESVADIMKFLLKDKRVSDMQTVQSSPTLSPVESVKNTSAWLSTSCSCEVAYMSGGDRKSKTTLDIKNGAIHSSKNQKHRFAQYGKRHFNDQYNDDAQSFLCPSKRHYAPASTPHSDIKKNVKSHVYYEDKNYIQNDSSASLSHSLLNSANKKIPTRITYNHKLKQQISSPKANNKKPGKDQISRKTASNNADISVCPDLHMGCSNVTGYSFDHCLLNNTDASKIRPNNLHPQCSQQKPKSRPHSAEEHRVINIGTSTSRNMSEKRFRTLTTSPTYTQMPLFKNRHRESVNILVRLESLAQKNLLEKYTQCSLVGTEKSSEGCSDPAETGQCFFTDDSRYETQMLEQNDKHTSYISRNKHFFPLILDRQMSPREVRYGNVCHQQTQPVVNVDDCGQYHLHYAVLSTDQRGLLSVKQYKGDIKEEGAFLMNDLREIKQRASCLCGLSGDAADSINDSLQSRKRFTDKQEGTKHAMIQDPAYKNLTKKRSHATDEKNLVSVTANNEQIFKNNDQSPDMQREKNMSDMQLPCKFVHAGKENQRHSHVPCKINPQHGQTFTGNQKTGSTNVHKNKQFDQMQMKSRRYKETNPEIHKQTTEACESQLVLPADNGMNVTKNVQSPLINVDHARKSIQDRKNLSNRIPSGISPDDHNKVYINHNIDKPARGSRIHNKNNKQTSAEDFADLRHHYQLIKDKMKQAETGSTEDSTPGVINKQSFNLDQKEAEYLTTDKLHISKQTLDTAFIRKSNFKQTTETVLSTRISKVGSKLSHRDNCIRNSSTLSKDEAIVQDLGRSNASNRQQIQLGSLNETLQCTDHKPREECQKLRAKARFLSHPIEDRDKKKEKLLPQSKIRKEIIERENLMITSFKTYADEINIQPDGKKFTQKEHEINRQHTDSEVCHELQQQLLQDEENRHVSFKQGHSLHAKPKFNKCMQMTHSKQHTQKLTKNPHYTQDQCVAIINKENASSNKSPPLCSIEVKFHDHLGEEGQTAEVKCLSYRSKTLSHLSQLTPSKPIMGQEIETNTKLLGNKATKSYTKSHQSSGKFCPRSENQPQLNADKSRESNVSKWAKVCDTSKGKAAGQEMDKQIKLHRRSQGSKDVLNTTFTTHTNKSQLKATLNSKTMKDHLKYQHASQGGESSKANNTLLPVPQGQVRKQSKLHHTLLKKMLKFCSGEDDIVGKKEVSDEPSGHNKVPSSQRSADQLRASQTKDGRIRPHYEMNNARTSSGRTGDADSWLKHQTHGLSTDALAAGTLERKYKSGSQDHVSSKHMDTKESPSQQTGIKTGGLTDGLDHKIMDNYQRKSDGEYDLHMYAESPFDEAEDYRLPDHLPEKIGGSTDASSSDSNQDLEDTKKDYHPTKYKQGQTTLPCNTKSKKQLNVDELREKYVKEMTLRGLYRNGTNTVSYLKNVKHDELLPSTESTASNNRHTLRSDTATVKSVSSDSLESRSATSGTTLIGQECHASKTSCSSIKMGLKRKREDEDTTKTVSVSNNLCTQSSYSSKGLLTNMYNIVVGSKKDQHTNKALARCENVLKHTDNGNFRNQEETETEISQEHQTSSRISVGKPRESHDVNGVVNPINKQQMNVRNDQSLLHTNGTAACIEENCNKMSISKSYSRCSTSANIPVMDGSELLSQTSEIITQNSSYTRNNAAQTEDSRFKDKTTEHKTEHKNYVNSVRRKSQHFSKSKPSKIAVIKKTASDARKSQCPDLQISSQNRFTTLENKENFNETKSRNHLLNKINTKYTENQQLDETQPAHQISNDLNMIECEINRQQINKEGRSPGSSTDVVVSWLDKENLQDAHQQDSETSVRQTDTAISSVSKYPLNTICGFQGGMSIVNNRDELMIITGNDNEQTKIEAETSTKKSRHDRSDGGGATKSEGQSLSHRQAQEKIKRLWPHWKSQQEKEIHNVDHVPTLKESVPELQTQEAGLQFRLHEPSIAADTGRLDSSLLGKKTVKSNEAEFVGGFGDASVSDKQFCKGENDLNNKEVRYSLQREEQSKNNTQKQESEMKVIKGINLTPHSARIFPKNRKYVNSALMYTMKKQNSTCSYKAQNNAKLQGFFTKDPALGTNNSARQDSMDLHTKFWLQTLNVNNPTRAQSHIKSSRPLNFKTQDQNAVFFFSKHDVSKENAKLVTERELPNGFADTPCSQQRSELFKDECEMSSYDTLEVHPHAPVSNQYQDCDNVTETAEVRQDDHDGQNDSDGDGDEGVENDNKSENVDNNHPNSRLSVVSDSCKVSFDWYKPTATLTAQSSNNNQREINAYTNRFRNEQPGVTLSVPDAAPAHNLPRFLLNPQACIDPSTQEPRSLAEHPQHSRLPESHCSVFQTPSVYDSSQCPAYFVSGNTGYPSDQAQDNRHPLRCMSIAESSSEGSYSGMFSMPENQLQYEMASHVPNNFQTGGCCFTSDGVSMISEDAQSYVLPIGCSVSGHHRKHDSNFAQVPYDDGGVSNLNNLYQNLQKNYNQANAVFHSNWVLANQNNSLSTSKATPGHSDYCTNVMNNICDGQFQPLLQQTYPEMHECCSGTCFLPCHNFQTSNLIFPQHALQEDVLIPARNTASNCAAKNSVSNQAGVQQNYFRESEHFLPVDSQILEAIACQDVPTACVNVPTAHPMACHTVPATHPMACHNMPTAHPMASGVFPVPEVNASTWQNVYQPFDFSSRCHHVKHLYQGALPHTSFIQQSRGRNSREWQIHPRKK